MTGHGRCPCRPKQWFSGGVFTARPGRLFDLQNVPATPQFEVLGRHAGVGSGDRGVQAGGFTDRRGGGKCNIRLVGGRFSVG